MKENNRQWKYVEKDGNPTEVGEYYVTLIHPVYDPGKTFIVKMVATVGIRYFGEYEEAPTWAMKDQPKEGLVWFEQSGSDIEEHVHAWMPKDEMFISDLPDGVEIED